MPLPPNPEPVSLTIADQVILHITPHPQDRSLTLGVGAAPHVQLNAHLTRPELVLFINSLIAALKSL